MTKKALADGSGLAQLRRFIEAQGGNPGVIDDYSLFPQASVKDELKAEKDGFVAEIAARTIGLASQHTGAGRATKESDIDLAAGVYLHKKVGDKVSAGETLAVFYGNDRAKVDAAMAEAKKAFRITDEPCQRSVLIYVDNICLWLCNFCRPYIDIGKMRYSSDGLYRGYSNSYHSGAGFFLAHGICSGISGTNRLHWWENFDFSHTFRACHGGIMALLF